MGVLSGSGRFIPLSPELPGFGVSVRVGVSLAVSSQGHVSPGLALASCMASQSLCCVFPPYHGPDARPGWEGWTDRHAQEVPGTKCQQPVLCSPIPAVVPIASEASSAPRLGSALLFRPTVPVPWATEPDLVLPPSRAAVPRWSVPEGQPGPWVGGMGPNPVIATSDCSWCLFSAIPTLMRGAGRVEKPCDGPRLPAAALCSRPVGICCFPLFMYVYFLVFLQTIC